MLKNTAAVLLAVLLVCVVGLEGRPRKAGRGGHGGHGGHGRPHRGRLGLKDLVCASENSEGLSCNSSCPRDAQCNVGPLTFNRHNVTVNLTLCALESQLLLAACRVENTTGAVYLQKECHDESSCSLGPLSLTRDSEAVLAYYCTPKDDSSEESSEEEEEEEEECMKRGKPGKGKGKPGKGKSGSSESSESSEESMTTVAPAE